MKLGAAVAARPPCMGAERSLWTFSSLFLAVGFVVLFLVLFAVALFHVTHALPGVWSSVSLGDHAVALF